METEPRSGLDVPAGDIQQLIPTLTGTSLSPSKFFAGVQDEEQNKARLKREIRQNFDNPDEGASSDEDGYAPLFHTGSNV